LKESVFKNINFENDKRNRQTNKCWKDLIFEDAIPDRYDESARRAFNRPAYHQEYMRKMNEGI